MGFSHREERTVSESKKMWKQAGRFGAVGLEMGIAVVIGMLGGDFLDTELDTEPVFFWIGFALGLAAAAKAVVDAARQVKKSWEKDGSQAADED